ncbi:hypothetical protein [Kribbella sp. NPDC049227]|uniref:hypothetical protein n=1 Tax=Kribbella sp. NPDC049227 TaxID=3364113 RepID=UPI003720EE00
MAGKLPVSGERTRQRAWFRNGSQFFLVSADSRLRPDYTVFGSVDRLGLKVLDRVAAGGVVPTPDDPAPVDGTPQRKTDT